VENSPIDAGQLVLSPTRTYAPIIKKILDNTVLMRYTEWYIAGGAQTKILHFVEKLTYHKRQLISCTFVSVDTRAV
jgi:phosphoribosylformylglycinamidine cyclo-ligase